MAANYSDTDHEVIPVEGSVFRTGAGNASGLRANLNNQAHYPVEAICQACGLVVESRNLFAGWTHTTRKPGDPR